jgi:hypothetical protein
MEDGRMKMKVLALVFFLAMGGRGLCDATAGLKKELFSGRSGITPSAGIPIMWYPEPEPDPTIKVILAMIDAGYTDEEIANFLYIYWLSH